MRREYAGGAKPAQLTASLGGSTADLTIVCDDLSNYPTGATGPFYVVIDRGLAAEEKILCESRSSNIITVYNTGLTNGRGTDGTSVISHSIGATIEHVFTAADADEANAHVNSNTTAHGLSLADVVITDATQTLSNKTLASPIISGTLNASRAIASGDQDLADYRFRNVYVDTNTPSSGAGNNGDLWVQYNA